jgi:DNA-binding beta-propeller fold protein YncE
MDAAAHPRPGRRPALRLPRSSRGRGLDSGTDSVTPIRIATNTALKPINVGQGPEGIAITPGEKTVYVVSWFTDTLTHPDFYQDPAEGDKCR